MITRTSADSASEGDLARKEILQLIEDVGVAMFTTLDEGTMRARPMISRPDPARSTIWFFTREEAHKVEELGRDPRVSLSYADPGTGRFASLSGAAELEDDRTRVKDLWDDKVAGWIGSGPDDPDLLLIKVKPEAGEFWGGGDRRQFGETS